MGDDPPYLMVGTEVSAKYKGAFCEAKIRKVVRVVKCRVTFKAGQGSATIPDDHIKGDLRVGSTVEAKHPDKNQFIEATINKIQDSSQYTVVFDDGDITTLRRSALCLKSGRHFNESETLDQLPLTHPEHFSNPVVGGRRGVRRRAANNDDNDNESSDDEDVPAKKGRKKPNKEVDMGKIVCVESTDKKKNSKDSWFPALIVCPSAQDTVKIRTKDEYLVRSFRDGRYYTVPKKETTEFTKESINKSEHSSNILRTACEKAVQYLERNELPPHWDREVLFGHGNTGEGSDEGLSDSGSSEDETHEEKDRFVAQLYKFMDDCGSPIGKVPAIGGKDLDLHKLYQVVMSKGGYNKVCNAGQWKAVTVKMGYGASPAMVTVNFLKQSYKKLLQNFEEFYRKMGPFDSLNALSNSGSKSRSNRSIFRDRSTKDSKKEEVKDEDDKKSVGSAAGAASSVAGESPEEIDAETESVFSEKLEADRTEEPRRSRSRLDSRGKKESEELPEKKGKRNSKKKDTERERDKERENSRTPVSASPSPAPSNKRGGFGGRNRKKKENTTEPGEVKSEPEESHDHIDKNVKIHKGDKVQVYYGPKSKGNVTYKAKVIDIDEAGSIPKYLVHYTGWNTRYDEWIERYRIASLSPQKDMGKDTNEDASEADSNGGPAGGKPPATKVVKKKGRPSGGQSKKTGGVRKNQTTEADKPRKGRVRKRSEHDVQSGSGSDADSSDSDDKQVPKVTTPSSDSSVASSSAVDGRSRRDAAQKAEPVNDDDDNSSSSSVSATASVSKKSETGVGGSDDIRNSPLNVGSSAIDLAQIRSEMKGLDKLVKMSQNSTVGSSSPITIPRSSSPVPAASVCVPQTEIKLDVYEFQEDVSDAPKLKIFQPTRSPDRKDEHVSLKEEDKSHRNFGDSDSAASSRPGTPSKVSHGQHRDEPVKKEKKKKEKEEDSPVYSPIKIPKPLLAAKESTKAFQSTPTSASSAPRASGSSIQSLQPSFPVEGKANLRMHTPLVHTPTQPVRQRAVITSYPPPLIPSGASKPPLSAAPVSSVITSSPPMPSLTQRPSLVSPPSNPVPAPQLHAQILHQARPTVAPRAVSVPPFASTSQVSMASSPSLQSTGTSVHNLHESSKPFMPRQQELYPNLAQQAPPKPVPLTVPKAPLPPVSITPVTSVHAPIDSVNLHTNLPPSGVSSAGKDASKISLGISGPPSSGIGFSNTMAKKSPVKRKQPSKDKLPKSPPNLMVSAGNTAARMDQSHLPPKKKAKKVITKNIIDPCKNDPEQVQSTFKTEPGLESPTKKARKPAKKRITQPESLGEAPQGVYLPSLERDTSPNKSPTKVMKKRPKMLIDPSGPPQLVPAKGPKAMPPTSYMGSVNQVPAPLPTAAPGAFSLITQSSSTVPCEVKSPMAYIEPVGRVTPPAKPVATLGNFSVMKPQDCKSYAPKAMGIAGLPRMMVTATDAVGKPSDHLSGTISNISTMVPSANNPKGISVPSVPSVATTTYVRMPNRFDPSPVVIATVTGPPSAPQKPITVIPLRTVASPTTSTQQRILGNTSEPNKSVSGVSVVFACDSRSDSKVKSVAVVPAPKVNNPPCVSTQPSIPVIKIPEVKEEKDDWRLADNDTPMCLVMKEESAASKSSIKFKEEELEDDDIKPTDLSVTATCTSSERSKSCGDRQEDQNAKEEDESCNSLLCEEEIPGSPPPGADFGIEEENSLLNPPCKKETNAILPDQKSVNMESWKDSKPEDSSPRSKSPRSSALEGSHSRKASTDGSQERPSNSGNNHERQQQPVPLVFSNNHHQQNLHHVIDNTPPTTPESSSLSSGSPRVDGGRVSPSNDHPSSSKSKDSSDLDSNDKTAEMNEEGSSSDAGRKYVKDSASSPQKKRHTESGRSAGNASPPGKRRRVQRRKSPDDMRSYTSYRGRGSAGGRKGTEKDVDHGKIQPPPPPINLTRPPVSKKFNLIPNLDETMDSEVRIQALQQALQTIKEKYQEVKSELSSEERRLKRFKRRLKDREKEKSKIGKST